MKKTSYGMTMVTNGSSSHCSKCRKPFIYAGVWDGNEPPYCVCRKGIAVMSPDFNAPLQLVPDVDPAVLAEIRARAERLRAWPAHKDMPGDVALSLVADILALLEVLS